MVDQELSLTVDTWFSHYPDSLTRRDMVSYDAIEVQFLYLTKTFVVEMLHYYNLYTLPREVLNITPDI